MKSDLPSHTEPAGRKLLSPGPPRVLCGSSSSPEYQVFLSRFCNAHRAKGNKEDFGEVGMAECRSLIKHISERTSGGGGGQPLNSIVAVLCSELEVVMIVARSQAHQCMFVEQGAIEAVTAVMGTYLMFDKAQVCGFKALINLCKGELPKTLSHQCGAVNAVVTAMTEHKEMDEVQEVGCWCLGALVAAHQESKQRAGECGGIDAVCRALRAYSGHEGLQQVALWALGSLAANASDNASQIGKRGGIQLVVNAMRNFSENPQLQEMGCWALANLAACNARCAEYIGKKEGPQAIISAMKQFPKAANVQYTGVVALSHLGSDAAIEKLLSFPSFALFQ